MAKYLVKDTTMSNIADAIREKTGLTSAIYPANMPSYIRSIVSGTQSSTDGIPSDIVAEAERVSSSMINKMGGNALTFIAISDMHEMGDSDHTDAVIIERYRRANKNAGQAAKIISDRVGLDFCAFLGDYAWGANNSSSTTTFHDLTQSITTAKSYLEPIKENTELIEVLGNHDPLFDIKDSSGNMITNQLITGMIGNYRYLDIESRKVRVIALNTAEYYAANSSRSTASMSSTQLQWFANSLDLSSKTDADKWGIVILGHHALDYSGMENAKTILTAYLSGSSYSQNISGVVVSYNYSGKNKAKVIANFHGHVHCLKTANISGTTVQRIAIPNACFGRNNEYGQEGNYTVGEETRCLKYDDNTGRNTAFCLVSIDLDEKIIYADCFGSLGVTQPGINAGYDRVISYGEVVPVTYTVTNSLTNATNSNGVASIIEGTPYSATITANSGYELVSVSVTMGGTNITSSVVSGGNINIPNVTGNIVITAVTTKAAEPHTITYDFANVTSNNMASQVENNASYTAKLSADSGSSINFVRVIMGGVDVTSTAYSNGTISISKVTGDLHIIAGYYTNLVPTATVVNGTALYNGKGYKDGYRISSAISESATSGYVMTGQMPYALNSDGTHKTIYIKGVTLDLSDNYCRWTGCPASVNASSTNCVQLSCASTAGASYMLETYFTIETLGTNYYKLTPKEAGFNSHTTTVGSMLMSLKGSGVNMIVTVDQPIQDVDNSAPKNFSVTNNLTNATTSNGITSVQEGSQYSATISPSSGYSVSSIKVTMGGTDITSSAVSGNKINIASVTGNIAITVTTTKLATYTNLVPTATVVNGTTVYNSKGYKDGYRISSAIGESAKSGYVITGVMPYMEDGNGKRKTIYIKGATLDTTDSNCRWSGLPYQVNATASNCIQLNGNASAAANQFSTYFTIETLGTNYYKLIPIESKFDAWTGSPIGRMMMSLKGSGANLIVTTDEPIG